MTKAGKTEYGLQPMCGRKSVPAPKKLVSEMKTRCECCGKEIVIGDDIIVISHGNMKKDRVVVYAEDYFHKGCDVAIRSV